METDWYAAARAFAPEIPPDELKRIVPVLERLEQSLQPVSSRLPLELPPATDLEPER